MERHSDCVYMTRHSYPEYIKNYCQPIRKIQARQLNMKNLEKGLCNEGHSE